MLSSRRQIRSIVAISTLISALCACMLWAQRCRGSYGQPELSGDRGRRGEAAVLKLAANLAFEARAGRPALPKAPRSGTAGNPRPIRVCLMLPVLSYVAAGEDVTQRETIERMPVFSVQMASLLDTSRDDDGFQYIYLLGTGFDDVVFGKPELRAVAEEVAKATVGARKNVHVILRTLYATSGTTVLWNMLALWGYDIGCDYFVPANDDQAWVTPGWASAAVTDLRGKVEPCPNFGIVAFHDLNQPDLPTFHVVSRLHMHIHARAYYPLPLIGYEVDPWIFDSYRLAGAATNHTSIVISNRVSQYDRATKTVLQRLPEELERYDVGSLELQARKDALCEKEAADLRAWMTDESNVCCDSIECSELQAGSELELPVLGVFS